MLASIPGGIDGENITIRPSDLKHALLGDKLGRTRHPDVLAVAFAGLPVSQLQGDDADGAGIHREVAVSYTHLTLPTILRV